MEIRARGGYALRVEANCALCDRTTPEPLRIGDARHACVRCARQLGELLDAAPERLVRVFPQLVEPDDGEPEPRIRLADGRSIELRERTAQLKAELPLEKRAELVILLGEIGLLREQALEAGFVLRADAPRELVERAAWVLLEPLDAEALRELRRHLMPV